MSEVQTITAIATPPGEGALAVVRVSGRTALEVADRVFRGRKPLARAPGFTVHYGHAVDRSGERIDEVLATVFRSPRSYTGEDMVEFGCHGGAMVPASLMDALAAAGARNARPGEFTRRAFLNGRIDLSQAEAVADLIAARSRRAQRASLEQLAGRLGARVGGLRKELMDLCALLEIDLDFAEEGLVVISPAEVGATLAGAAAHVRSLASSYKEGRLYREGVSVVFAGKPNAGKSSLFNALLKEERAIVTSVPGTTRDYLEESVTFDGLTFRLFDTAGLHASTDTVEQIGIARTHSALRTADIVVVVEDARERTDPDGNTDTIPAQAEGQQVIVARNKIDLAVRPHGSVVQEKPGKTVVHVSALTGEGIHELRAALIKLASSGVHLAEHDVIVTNRRHLDALLRAANGLDRAHDSIVNGATNDLIALDLREAVNTLAEITGEITSEDILNEIFARFCIGK